MPERIRHIKFSLYNRLLRMPRNGHYAGNSLTTLQSTALPTARWMSFLVE